MEMERTTVSNGLNLNVNGGTGIITNLSRPSNNSNHYQQNNQNNLIGGMQQLQHLPHQMPQLPPGLALVRPQVPVGSGSTSILQDALRGQSHQRSTSALFPTPSLHQQHQINQVFYQNPQQQQQNLHQINQDVYHPHHQLQQELKTVPNPFAKMSLDEIVGQIFKKYFQRHPTIDPNLFKIRERALQEAMFDFILHVPIVIDGNQVPRKAWAKAFYEMDVIQSAKCLFEALFDQEEMSKCTLNGKNNTRELSAVKMLAIMRASCWMKNKEQDPYSFNPGYKHHNVFPTKDERDKIEKKVFTERRSQANRKLLKAGNKRAHDRSPPHDIDNLSRHSTHEGDSDNSQHSEPFQMKTLDNALIKPEIPSYDGKQSYPYNNQNGNFDTTEKKPYTVENLELEELYARYPDEFLDKLYPGRTDVFIDGILIPIDVWDKAFQEAEKDTVKAAWTLFQFLFSSEEIMSCTLNGKNGTTELCPVRKLAIIRAVQWMSVNAKGKKTEFDSDINSCNLFPSEEDKERIETKVFTEKRYQHSRQLNTKFGNGNSSGGFGSNGSMNLNRIPS